MRYEITIKGNDMFELTDEVSAEDFDHAISIAKKNLTSYKFRTIESLRVTKIEEL